MIDYVTAEDLYLSVLTDGRMYNRCCLAARIKDTQARAARFDSIINTGWKNYQIDVAPSIIKVEDKAKAARMLEADRVAHVKEIDSQLNQMNNYKITFNGREKNAIGITYEITATVEAEDEQAALLKLYDKYEHISLPQVKLLNK